MLIEDALKRLPKWALPCMPVAIAEGLLMAGISKRCHCRGVKLGGARPHLKAHNQQQARQLKLEAAAIAPFVLPLRQKGSSLRKTTAALNEFGLKTRRGSKWHLSRIAEVCQYLKANMNDENQLEGANLVAGVESQID
jgi:hypothetical protein